MNRNIKILLFSGLLLGLLFSCDHNYVPKPKGYFRLDIPKPAYIAFDTTFPYAFDYSAYARILPDTNPNSEPYWINVNYPRFRGTIHISYKKVNGNLEEYLEDSRTFVMKHIPKADAIEDSLIYIPERKVFGLI